MPKIFQCIIQASLNLGQYLAKLSEHGLNICSGNLIIQKSLAKQSQAIKIWSLDLLYPVLLGLSGLFSNQNSAL
ncbi:hypothetical protein JCM21142_104299 [Saccharicrinis fermentans DSM 9555 = JCM 21142]|uniref:Uncharacterized protein n=1 Tax=Saccharicrinis fermentans DSM 9555 = JCM 21142 TaxID=869213 RepID=W7YSX6_9BACT|nr:hypothetical protein JCM21142_104299 [Saccharicrinis fermentans DSM 9555 = JCM 21142]